MRSSKFNQEQVISKLAAGRGVSGPIPCHAGQPQGYEQALINPRRGEPENRLALREQAFARFVVSYRERQVRFL